MAWSFRKGDLNDIALVALVHPDPVSWWTTVQADNNDPDVAALAAQVLAAYSSGGDPSDARTEAIVEELRRIADTEAELEVTRIDEDSGGNTVTYQAKGKGFIG